MQSEAGMGQDKTMQGEDENSIIQPHPTPLPSLLFSKTPLGQRPDRSDEQKRA